MLILVTGQPGNGKTLNTIKMVDEDHKDRKIYASGIPELKLENWHFLDSGANWMNCDDGSVIVIDEAHEVMPSRQHGKPTPACVEALAKHRHRGIDIYVITQHPKSIDVEARRRVGRHIHYKRKFGSPLVIRWEFQECKDDLDHFAFRDGVSTTVKLDKKYFDVYKSAEVHTHKTRLPWKVAAGIPFVLLGAAGLLYNAGSTILGLGSGGKEEQVAEVAENITPPTPQQNLQEFTHTDWQAYWTPRVRGISWTAPVYDELLKPSSFPKPNCIATEKKCKCYTQQATLMPIPESVCRDIVNNGWFDPTKKEPTTPESRQGARVGA